MDKSIERDKSMDSSEFDVTGKNRRLIENELLMSQPFVVLYEYPNEKCSVCGGTLNLKRHCIHVYAARKIATLPGPAGITHEVEYKKGNIIAYLCQNCRNRGTGLIERIEFSIALILITLVVCGGVALGMGVFAVILILPAGGILGFLLSLVNKLFRIATPIEDMEVPGVRKILSETCWELGEKPSKSAIKYMPEYWPWDEKKLNEKRKAERKQLIEKLRPKTIFDKACLLLILLFGILMIGGFIWLIVTS